MEAIRSGDISVGGAAGHTFNYAPVFNGPGSSLAAQVSREHQNGTAQILGALRNGQLKLPGR
jgi:hypothetical protein